MHLKQAKALARRLMNKHGLRKWEFHFSTSRSTFGATCHAAETIHVSGPLAKFNSRELIREVVLHEIAHALLPETSGHGPRWKKKAKELGVPAITGIPPHRYTKVPKGYTQSLSCRSKCGTVLASYKGNPYLIDAACIRCFNKGGLVWKERYRLEVTHD